LLSGCFWDEWNFFRPDVPPNGADTLILRGDQLVPEKTLTDPKAVQASKDLAGGHELYRLGDYTKAEAVFHYIAELKKSPPSIAEEARFYEAECLRRQERYPKAADTYHKTLIDWPSGSYREQCCQRLFDISNYWLEDTRAEMKAHDAGKEHWYSWMPVAHWEREKPLFDEEGRAVEALEWVHVNDITGPLADKSLFLAGSVMFFRENYREADHYFTQLVQDHHNSPLVPQSIELGIISKHMSTGGADYDGRKVAEARQLINTALNKYPVLATEKKDFLVRQLCACTMQQAEKDFKIAEFYKRTGHPGSAYFYYEIVRRRYPGTPFFDQATTRMLELRQELEKQHASLPPEPPAPGQTKTLPATPPSGPEQAPPPQPVTPTPGNTPPPVTETPPQPTPPRTLAPAPGVTGGKPN
jgi:outer membrane protein assembly factor BamD (BamD/ComL family)